MISGDLNWLFAKIDRTLYKSGNPLHLSSVKQKFARTFGEIAHWQSKLEKKYVANKTLQNTVAIKVTKRIYQIQLQKGREPLQMAEKSQQWQKCQRPVSQLVSFYRTTQDGLFSLDMFLVFICGWCWGAKQSSDQRQLSFSTDFEQNIHPRCLNTRQLFHILQHKCIFNSFVNDIKVKH